MNTRRVFQILAAAAEKMTVAPMTVAEIGAEAALTNEQVRTALTCLKRRGHVQALSQKVFGGFDRWHEKRQRWGVTTDDERSG